MLDAPEQEENMSVGQNPEPGEPIGPCAANDPRATVGSPAFQPPGGRLEIICHATINKVRTSLHWVQAVAAIAFVALMVGGFSAGAWITGRWAQLQSSGEAEPPELDVRTLSKIVTRQDYAHLCAEEYFSRPLRPALLGDPERLEKALPAGRSFDMLVKGGFTARLPDKTYGNQRRTNLVYVCEMRVARTIEENSGRQCVERWTFLEARMAKLLTPVEDLQLDLGPAGAPLLADLPAPAADEGIALADVAEMAHRLLGRGANEVAADQASRALLADDGLAGREVRVTALDGLGVRSVEPLGWELEVGSALEYLFHLPVFAHWQLLPDADAPAMSEWTVPAEQIEGFLLPLLPAIEDRSVVIRKVRDYRLDAVDYCDLEGVLAPPPIPIDSPVAKMYLSRAVVQYNRTEDHVSRAEFQWPLTYLVTHAAPEKFFHERQFQQTPIATVIYSCRAR
jgi:hypothetical protein